jgi:probable rRNA maturation factor
MLRAIGHEQSELSVLLVDDERIRELNREHRDKDRPTDVLAFPLPKVRRPPPGSPVLLGDIVISLPTALRQAKSRKRALLFEVRFLLAHGLLHLVGFDHATKAQKRTMDRETRRLVKAAAVATQGKPKREAKTRRKLAATPTSRTNFRGAR